MNKELIAMVGAGELTSALYRLPDDNSDFRYSFNLYRVSERSGQVSHLIRSKDLIDLLKLVQVLSAEIANDGWITEEEKKRLRWIEKTLEAINCHTHRPQRDGGNDVEHLA